MSRQHRALPSAGAALAAQALCSAPCWTPRRLIERCLRQRCFGGGAWAARALCSAAAEPDGASGGSPARDHARASVCGGYGGAAPLPTPQLAEPGLSSQARLPRCCCVGRRHGATTARNWPCRGAASAGRRGPGSTVVLPKHRGNIGRCLRQATIGRRGCNAVDKCRPGTFNP